MRLTSALATPFFFLKFPEFSPIRIFRHPGFALMLVSHPVFFNIVAGPAFPGFSKNLAVIQGFHRGDMQRRIEILVNMATLAILANHLISLSRTKIPLKRLLNFNGGAPREKRENQDRQETLGYETIGFCRKYFSKMKCEVLSIHRSHAKPSDILAKHQIQLDRLETYFSVVFQNFIGIALREITFTQKPA